jgi:hypothetical protein
MTIHVFLGPSLPLARARDILDATYHPPVRVGDVCDLVVDRAPPAAIAIVDGLFEQTPTVWHKEILFAMSKGVHVYGASSMGAIRAAELHSFGMIGVGEIFERFRSGELEDDDEVAVVHAPPEDGSRPLSEAMVNLRHGIEVAVGLGLVGPHTAASLIADVKALFYPDRSWAAVQELGHQRGLPATELEALRGFVRDVAPNLKRRDAITLLSRLAAVPADLTPATAGFTFEPTYNWEKLVAIVRSRGWSRELASRAGAGAPHVHAAVGTLRPDLLQSALLDCLMRREAHRLGLVEPASGAPLDTGACFQALVRRYEHELHEFLLTRSTPAELADAVTAWQATGHDDPHADEPAILRPGHRTE